MKMIRKPIVSGVFYPSDKDGLVSELKESYVSKFGYGKEGSYGNAVGGIVPHAGYSYSGPCASHVYSRLKKNVDTIIVLGTNHSGYGEPISLSDEIWTTPLGKIEPSIDKISRLTKKGYRVDNKPHRQEHSIEVQIPFIQDKFPKAKIIPISISHKASLCDLKALAKELSGIDALYISSSDLTHYGYNYDFVPFDGTREYIRGEIYKLDRCLISAIEKLDSEEFLKLSEKTTICGAKAIVVLLEIAKIKKLKPKLLQYYTSGDLLGDYTNAVGYAAISFE